MTISPWATMKQLKPCPESQEGNSHFKRRWVTPVEWLIKYPWWSFLWNTHDWRTQVSSAHVRAPTWAVKGNQVMKGSTPNAIVFHQGLEQDMVTIQKTKFVTCCNIINFSIREWTVLLFLIHFFFSPQYLPGIPVVPLRFYFLSEDAVSQATAFRTKL